MTRADLEWADVLRIIAIRRWVEVRTGVLFGSFRDYLLHAATSDGIPERVRRAARELLDRWNSVANGREFFLDGLAGYPAPAATVFFVPKKGEER